MSLLSIAGNALQISRIIALSAVCCASAALADPSTAPFTYDYESIGEAPASEAESEPELASALPQITDPVQKVMHAVVTVEATARSGARTESTFGTNRKGTGAVSYTHLTLPTIYSV